MSSAIQMVEIDQLETDLQPLSRRLIATSRFSPSALMTIIAVEIVMVKQLWSVSTATT